MTAPQLPTWPTSPVSYSPVVLRRFSALDVPMVRELSTDPYVPLIGTLAPNASQQEIGGRRRDMLIDAAIRQSPA
jgi:[ribosomal protein S5]-alanine N-acetyltransferase